MNTQEITHTSTPYSVDWSAHFGTAQVVGRMFDNHGFAVATCAGPNGKANAEFIVKACNRFESADKAKAVEACAMKLHSEVGFAWNDFERVKEIINRYL